MVRAQNCIFWKSIYFTLFDTNNPLTFFPILFHFLQILIVDDDDEFSDGDDYEEEDDDDDDDDDGSKSDLTRCYSFWNFSLFSIPNDRIYIISILQVGK